MSTHRAALRAADAQVASPYLRFHAAHAVARLCVQAPVDEVVMAVRLERLRLADLS